MSLFAKAHGKRNMTSEVIRQLIVARSMRSTLGMTFSDFDLESVLKRKCQSLRIQELHGNSW